MIYFLLGCWVTMLVIISSSYLFQYYKIKKEEREIEEDLGPFEESMLRVKESVNLEDFGFKYNKLGKYYYKQYDGCEIRVNSDRYVMRRKEITTCQDPRVFELIENNCIERNTKNKDN